MSESVPVEALREAGVEERDPVRFHYAEALARRLQGAPGAVQPIVEARLQSALAELAACMPASVPAAQGEGGAMPPEPVLTPLAQLNLHIAAAVDEADGDAGTVPELRSAGRFRRAWSRMHADDTVEEAIVRGPENAGPLNSHALVLRTLTLLRELSPDYLRRFLVQAEAMLWLEQGRGRLGLPSLRNRSARTGTRPDAPNRDKFSPPP